VWRLEDFYSGVILLLLMYFTSYSYLYSMFSSFCTVLRLIKMAENIDIKEVLDYPFSVRLLYDKLRTVNKGRPTPPLLSLITHHKSKTEQYTRNFFISQYEKIDWLTGCETTNFIVSPVYMFLTNMKYGINRTSGI